MNKLTKPRRQIFRGQISTITHNRNPYILIPFKVHQGIRAVEIRYDYDNDTNILDLGVFDPRGCEFLTPQGFRGWSGSARKAVIISEDWATPGYIPGPIYPGIWHVIIGIYKVGPHGCAYEVEVRLYPDPIEINENITPGAYKLYGPNTEKIERSGWFKGDLHCHTHHSDAEASVKDLIKLAEKKNLDFLAITDHNTISHWKEIEELKGTKVILIPGEEITTYLGHANVWGQGRWLDFRCLTTQDIAAVYSVASGENRLFSINHPKPGGPPWEFGFEVPFDCLEVWHALWSMENETSLELWDTLLKNGERIVAVGGSDAHPRFRRDGILVDWLGYPTTWVFASQLSAEAILDAIRNGRVSISVCPSGPLVFLKLYCCGEFFYQGSIVPSIDKGKVEVEVIGGMGLELLLITTKGICLRERVTDMYWSTGLTLNMKAVGYLRAEVRIPLPDPRPGPLAALTNPLWCESYLSDKTINPWRPE